MSGQTSQGRPLRSPLAPKSAFLRWAPLSTILIVGAIVRWHNIGDLSLWLDELAQVRVAQSPMDSFFAGVRSHTAAAPLDYLATKGVLGVLGFSTVGARVWAFAMGLVTIAAVYGAALHLTTDRRAAHMAAALTAASPFLVFYSQEARFYSMAAAMTVAVLWIFSRLVSHGRRGDWIAFVVLGIGAVYTHYFLALVMAVGALAVAGVDLIRWFRDGLSGRTFAARAAATVRIGAAGALILVAFAPWYLYAVRAQLAFRNPYPDVAELTAERLFRTFETLLAGVPRTVPVTGDALADPLLTVAVLVLAALGAVQVGRRRPAVAVTMVVIAVGLVPLVWWSDAQTGYFVSERQFISLVPIVYILAGAGSIAAWGARGRVAQRVSLVRWFKPLRPGMATIVGFGLACLLLAASAPGLARVWDGSFRPKEDWRGASRYVVSAACAGGDVYTNVPSSFGFGIGIYAPELVSRSTYLQETDAYEFLGDVLRRYQITPSDIVVVFRDRPGVFVPGRGNIQTVTDYLYSVGLRAREFTPRIRVFASQTGCEPSSAGSMGHVEF